MRLVEEGEESMAERDVMTDSEIDNVKVSGKEKEGEKRTDIKAEGGFS